MAVLWGSALVPMRTRIQQFRSMRIRSVSASGSGYRDLMNKKWYYFTVKKRFLQQINAIYLSLDLREGRQSYYRRRIRIRDPVPFWPLDPGSGIGFFRIPDLGSRIPNPYFWEFSDNFLSKKFNKSLKIGPNFFVQHFKHKIIYNFVKFMAIKKGMTTIFFSPLSFVAVFGSGIRDG